MLAPCTGVPVQLSATTSLSLAAQIYIPSSCKEDSHIFITTELVLQGFFIDDLIVDDLFITRI